jgi:hypothetical protein
MPDTRASGTVAQQPCRQHLVISGTGRAGTSFLVRFLEACGLPAGGDDARWYERARAGGEHPLDAEMDLPYVVKDPSLWTYCQTLDLTTIHIDGLLVPIRDLTEAAGSRILQERAAIAETGWQRLPGIDVYGRVPGGALYSLLVADQMRILAVGFHGLLRWAVSNNIPTLLLDFPRIVEDAEYLIDRLSSLPVPQLDRETALAAHARIAEPKKIRLRGTAARKDESFELARSRSDEYLDREALVLRIREMEAERTLQQSAAEAVQGRLDETGAALDEMRTALGETRRELDKIRDDFGTQVAERDELIAAAATSRARLEHEVEAWQAIRPRAGHRLYEWAYCRFFGQTRADRRSRIA